MQHTTPCLLGQAGESLMPPRKGRARQSDLTVSDLPGPSLEALVQDHLTDEDRLSLFQVSRGTAVTVLKHAASIELRLEHRSIDTARELHARRHIIETLLAAAPEAQLKVYLAGQNAAGVHDISGSTSLWSGSIRQQVKQLTVRYFTLTADMLQNQLQLQQCPHLHTLVLANPCSSSVSRQQVAVLARQRTSIFPPTFQHLQEEHWDPCLSSDMAHIVGPQLTHLTLHTYHSLNRVLMAMFSQLTHISIKILDDVAMEQLMTLPRLTHVEASTAWLQQSHASQQLRWQQLKLLGMTDVDRLLHLPLHHIQQLVLQGSIISYYRGKMQQASAHLATCPNLQCVPITEGCYLPGFPQFTIRSEPSTELVMLCASSMTATGCLTLTTPITANQGLLPCVNSLPSKVNMLCWSYRSDRNYAGIQQVLIEQRVQVLQQLVGALPQHITHFVVDHECRYWGDINAIDDTCAYARGIINHITDTEKPTQLMVRLYSENEIPAELEALAKAHPSHLRFVFMEL